MGKHTASGWAAASLCCDQFFHVYQRLEVGFQWDAQPWFGLGEVGQEVNDGRCRHSEWPEPSATGREHDDVSQTSLQPSGVHECFEQVGNCSRAQSLWVSHENDASWPQVLEQDQIEVQIPGDDDPLLAGCNLK